MTPPLTKTSFSSEQSRTLDRSCMRVRIRDELVARILDGRYEPGLHLKELSLAREFNVSQAPIREALRELEVLGLMISEPYRGSRVRGVDVDELAEAYELRALIEARSAELAVPCADGLCDQLSRTIDEIRVAIEAGDRGAHADAAVRFHRRLVEASGNRTFLATWDGFHWPVRARLSLRRVHETGGNLDQVVRQHELIVERLRENDGAGAAQAVQRNFELYVEQLRGRPARAA